MSSENNGKEKQILAFFTYSGIGIFIVVVSVIVYSNMKKQRAISPTPPPEVIEMPEVKILSSEEVSNERFTLERNNTIAEREKAGLSIKEAPKQKPVEEIVVNTPPQVADPSVVQVAKEEQAAKDPSTQNANQASNGVNKNPSSKPFSNFEEEVKKSTLEAKSAEGYLFQFNFDKNSILLDGVDGGLSSIRVDSQTEFKINGKNIKVTDLKIGDKLKVNGKGYHFTDEILAETVTVTGAISFF